MLSHLSGETQFVNIDVNFKEAQVYLTKSWSWDTSYLQWKNSNVHKYTVECDIMVCGFSVCVCACVFL